MNAFEERGRRAKTSALLRQLLSEHRTPEEITRWKSDRWTRLARKAGTNPPSYLTMTEVVRQLENRARRAA